MCVGDNETMMVCVGGGGQLGVWCGGQRCVCVCVWGGRGAVNVTFTCNQFSLKELSS